MDEEEFSPQVRDVSDIMQRNISLYLLNARDAVLLNVFCFE